MSNYSFLYRTSLEHRAISVYIYLDGRANSKGECWPSIGRIASDLKLSRRTVIRTPSDLRGAGLVTTEQRQGCRKANTQSASGRRTARCLHKALGRMVERVVWGLGWGGIDIALSD